MRTLLAFILAGLAGLNSATVDLSGHLPTLSASSEGGPRVLALLESNSLKETHSLFFSALSDLGFTLTFRVADDANIAIKKYGAYLYDHIILFSPSVEEFGGSLTVDQLVDFVDAGGNVLVAASDQTGDILREIAAESGFEADEEGAAVIDHLNFDVELDAAAGGKHTTVLADPANLIKSEEIVGKSGAKGAAPILYRGTGLIVDRQNPHVLEILTASSAAYSHKPDQAIKAYPHAVGKNTVLVAGLQAKNNARVVFSGSLDLFSDEFFIAAVTPSNGGQKRDQSGNQELAKALATWCFQRSGVLRVTGVNHHRVGEKSPPALFYTIKEDVVYTIGIEEYKNGKWIPYQAKDVQMEFHRIDPFVRLTLKPNDRGTFEGKFKIPDVYGVYQFKVDYLKAGMTRVVSTTEFSVRPLRHDQYERFIGSAFPYYASAFSMMFGVFLLSVVFLHCKEEEVGKKKTE